MGYASLNGGARSEKIIDLCMRVNEIVEKLDKGYLESKKVRSYLERHESIFRPSIREKKVVRPGKNAMAESTEKHHGHPW